MLKTETNFLKFGSMNEDNGLEAKSRRSRLRSLEVSPRLIVRKKLIPSGKSLGNF